MFKSFKYRLYPTDTQKVLLEKHFGCARWVYNWALAEKMNRYVEAGVNVSIYELSAHLPQLKKREDTAWLKEVSSVSLGDALRNLDMAYTRFFKGESEFPKFKSKYTGRRSFQNHQDTSIDFDLQHVYILKFKEGISCNFSRRFEGKIKTSTVSRTATGKYWISILVETPDVEPILPPVEETKALGLDFGLKDLIVTSEGQRFENPKTLKRYLRRLQIRQRRLSKKVKGSKNRDKARHKVALVHEKISNIRNDNLHKISTELVRKNQATTLCIEDLNVAGMVKNRRLSRSISDAGWGELRRQLTYKCQWYGKNLKVIGRFEPSSKMCGNCGHIHSELTLKDREWTCAACGVTHDRDINAAKNIRTMAFREQNTESKPFREASAKRKYREVTRKSTPVEEPLVAPTKQESSNRGHTQFQQGCQVLRSEENSTLRSESSRML